MNIVLGITRDASPAEVRKSYRQLSLQLHPDKNKDDPDGAKKTDQYDPHLDPALQWAGKA